MSHLQAPRSSTSRSRSGNNSTEDVFSDATLTANEDSSAESTSTLIPLRGQAQHTSEEEEEKCWICFTSRLEDQTEPSGHGIWKSPCKCALTAHEGCLLDWISDLEKSPSSANKPIQCPQCKTNIMMREDRSAIVELGRSIERNVRRTSTIAIVAGIGSACFVVSTVYGEQALLSNESHNDLWMGQLTSSKYRCQCNISDMWHEGGQRYTPRTWWSRLSVDMEIRGRPAYDSDHPDSIQDQTVGCNVTHSPTNILLS